jgi:iron complex outermembrane recepter protein
VGPTTRILAADIVAATARMAYAGLLTAGIATHGHAQTVPTPERAADEATLPELRVTAKPTDTPAQPYAGGHVARGASLGLLGNADFMDAPFSTASYTEQAIRDQQAKSVGDLLTVVDPSVRDVVGRDNLYEAFTIRGLRVTNDDVALNGLYGLLPKHMVSTDAIERIELLKGPSALLNGTPPRGSTGGNINVVTKRAGAEPLTRLSAEYASDSRLGGHLDMGRRLGEDKQIGVRLNAAYRDGQPPIDRQATHDADLSLGLDYQGSRLRLSADLLYQADTIHAPERGYFLASGVGVPSIPSSGSNTSQSFDYSRTRATTGMVRAEYDLTDRTVLFAATGRAQFHWRRLDYQNGTQILNANGDAQAASVFQDADYGATSSEAGIRRKFSTGAVDHGLSIAASYVKLDQDLGKTAYASFLTNIYAPVLLAQPTAVTSSFSKKRAAETSLSGVAIADTASFAEGVVQLLGGVRHQKIKVDNFSATTGEIASQYDESATTPMVGVVLRPSKSLAVYGSYIEGLAQGPTAPGTSVNAGQIFKPYRTQQYEIGTKYDAGAWAVTVSAFQISVPNGITNTSTGVFGVDGEQRHRGVELMSFGELAHHLRWLSGLTAMDPRLTKTAGGTSDGHQAVGVPKVQANLGLEWDTSSVPGLTWAARAIYTGSRFLDAANTVQMPSWTRFDAGARYSLKAAGTPITLNLNVANLFNRRYWESNTSGYMSVGAPRTFALTVSADL